MNFLGHHEVAGLAGLDPAGRLGSMLPDFATMLGVRLWAEPLPQQVRAGVQVHHATDASFHSHPDVLAGMGSMTAAMSRAGLPRGAARGCGHVGYEMLLDAPVASTPIRAALAHAGDPGVHDALASHAEWLPMCEHLATRAARYDDPGWIAERLFHILGRRPRLRFAREQIPAVAAVLSDLAPAVHAAAARILADVTTDVTSSGLCSGLEGGTSVGVEVGAVGQDRGGFVDGAASASEAPFVDGQLVTACVDGGA
jgi:hypothetical protein